MADGSGLNLAGLNLAGLCVVGFYLVSPIALAVDKKNRRIGDTASVTVLLNDA